MIINGFLAQILSSLSMMIRIPVKRYVNGLRGVVIVSREVRMVWTLCMKFERCVTRPR
jgi:hypothetical protein